MDLHTDKGLSRFDPAEYLNSWSARWAYLDEAILSYEPRRGIFPNLAEQRNDFGAIWTVVRSLWASKPDAKP